MGDEPKTGEAALAVQLNKLISENSDLRAERDEAHEIMKAQTAKIAGLEKVVEAARGLAQRVHEDLEMLDVIWPRRAADSEMKKRHDKAFYAITDAEERVWSALRALDDATPDTDTEES